MDEGEDLEPPLAKDFSEREFTDRVGWAFPSSLSRRHSMKDKTVRWIGTLLMISLPMLFSCSSNRALQTKEAEGYFDLGTRYLQQGDDDQAISAYTRALEINPRYAEAYLNRGIAYRRKGQPDQAISDYTAVLLVDPKDARAYCNRGNAYIEKGQYDKAISDYNKALEINSKDPQVFFNRAVAYYSTREYDKSWADIKKAQGLRYQVPPDFLDDLRKASGREK
jgi:tetratricopeptide (TPR) repeat protein